MGCDSYEITDKDGRVIGGAITCSRGTKTKPCSFCRTRPGTLLCDFELGGALKGKTCDARMCSSCAVEFGKNKHRCPPHDRFVLANQAASSTAMVLEARQVAVYKRDAEAWLDALIANEVDRDALAEMFPAWDNDWHVSPDGPRGMASAYNAQDDDVGYQQANEISGELAATGCKIDGTNDFDLDVPMRRGLEMTVIEGEYPVDADGVATIKVRVTEPIDSLIERSSVGAAMRDVRERGIDAHLRDEEREAAAGRESISSKVRHVKRAGQTRSHTCHWPGCGRQVPPAMWGCREHWYQLPKYIQNKIWNAYRSGQEETMSPSRSYLEAAREAQEWIANNTKAG